MTDDGRRKVILPCSVVCRPILRKEVIQPQVPLRLPCYDFTPVADLTVVGCLPNPKTGVGPPFMAGPPDAWPPIFITKGL